mmetsp:Transcript_45460/g.84184  ORF Transcript_45460/g.84184 Transcript_45460/m.84184 type:complete len:295 (-) Transcript_45460:359-1243(-)
MIDDLQVLPRQRGDDLRQQSPLGLAVRLDAHEERRLGQYALPQHLLLLLLGQVARLDVVPPRHLHLGRLLNPLLGLLVPVRDGESQREGGEDGRQQNGQYDGRVQRLRDESRVDREDGDDERELSLGGHGESGREAVAQVQVAVAGRAVEVRDEESRQELAQEGEGEDEALPDDGAVAELRDGHLEADGGGEEDAHEPLKNPLELPDEHVMHLLAPAERQSGYEHSHEKTRLRVVRRGHEREHHPQHDHHLDRSVLVLVDLGQDEPIDERREDVHGDVSSQAQEEQGGDDGYDQ